MVKARPEIRSRPFKTQTSNLGPANHSQDLRGQKEAGSIFGKALTINEAGEGIRQQLQIFPSSLNGTCSSAQPDGASSHCLPHRYSISPAVPAERCDCPSPPRVRVSIFQSTPPPPPPPPFLPQLVGIFAPSAKLLR